MHSFCPVGLYPFIKLCLLVWLQTLSIIQPEVDQAVTLGCAIATPVRERAWSWILVTCYILVIVVIHRLVARRMMFPRDKNGTYYYHLRMIIMNYQCRTETREK